MEKDWKYDWPQYSKTEWLNQIAKEQKSEVLGKFDQEKNGITALAFAHADDIQNLPITTQQSNLEVDWSIGIELHSIGTEVLYVLEHGVEYIHFNLETVPAETHMHAFLDKVYLDHITSRWTFRNANISQIELWLQQCFARYPKTSKLYITTTENSRCAIHVLDLYTQAYMEWPTILQQLQTSSPSKVLLRIHADNDMLHTIAKIRALRQYCVDKQLQVLLECVVSQDVLNSDENANMLSITSIALTASMCGVDMITMPSPEVATLQQQAQWLRWPIHVQHILKQESHMHLVNNPWDGSYFMEHLTNQYYTLFNKA